MQARISRMAAVRWGWPLRRVMELFGSNDVLGYIEDCFDYFHLEGDEAVFDDIERYLRSKGAPVRTSEATSPMRSCRTARFADAPYGR